MSKRLKVGIIGCGGIANGKHLPSLKAINRVDLVAFCDLIEEKAIKAAKEYGTPDAKVYTDYQELLKDESIDVVHVLTPNRMHAQISIDALHAGKHVMCEKPMAKTAEDARRKESAEVRNQAEQLLYESKNAQRRLNREDKERIEGLRRQVEQAMQGTDDSELKRRMAELTNALQAVGRYMDNSAADDADGAVDADFSDSHEEKH